jgi:hypothetical protein
MKSLFLLILGSMSIGLTLGSAFDDEEPRARFIEVFKDILLMIGGVVCVLLSFDAT